MNEPWFDPSTFSWIPGTVFGMLAGLWGAMAGTMAPRGVGKSLVLGSGAALAVGALALLGLGIAALLDGQPYGIWYGLGLGGFVGSIVIIPIWFVIRQRYLEAEHRRMRANDL